MRYDNLPLAEVVEHLKAMAPDAQALLHSSIAASRHLSEKREDLILAHYVPHSEQPFTRSELTYNDLRLIKETVSVEHLCRKITHASRCGSFELFDGFTTDINDTYSLELLPSEAPPSKIGPRCYVKLSARNKGVVRQSGALIKYGHVSFESAEQAVRSWIPLRPFHGYSDGRIGEILIELPFLGPKLGTLTTQDDRLNIMVEGITNETKVQLTGVWQSKDANLIEPFVKEVTSNLVEVSRPSWAEQVSLWLVMPNSLVADFFFENPYHCSRSHRILHPSDADRNSNAKSVLAQIQCGEGENLELKPFLKPDADKFNELVRTLIAFANKRGGMICMGVSNHLEIDGVEKELRGLSSKNENASIDECAARYCTIIKTKINDRLTDKIEFQIEPIYICGKLLIRLVVEEGKQKPYSDFQSREIWTRKGANTVKPDPSELKQMMNKTSHPFDFPY